MSRRNAWIIVLVLCDLFGLCGLLLAQSRMAEINGVVTDAQNAAIPDATVTLFSQATGIKLTTQTDGAGLYHIEDLDRGSYRVEVSKAGFQTFVQTGFTMDVGLITHLNVVLKVGSTTQVVEVQGAAPALQTETPEVGLTVTQREMETLPILDRNAISLFNLNSSVDAKSDFPMGGNTNANLAMYINGASQELRLDGGGQDIAPTWDIVGEFRMLTNDYSPEFRGISSFVTETKSGTDRFHGTGYFWARDQAIAANPWGSTTALPFRRLEPGFTVGGPIRKDKAFFFGGWDRWQANTSSPQFYTIPTALQRTGNFSQTFDSSGSLIPIYDPSSTVIGSAGQVARTQFPGNIIPGAQIDPVGQAMMNYYPMPNLASVSPNFEGAMTTNTTSNQYYGRVDYHWSAKHRTYGSYVGIAVHSQNRYPFAPIGVFGDDNTVQPWKVFTLGHIYTPSSTWVLTTTFSYLNRTWQGISAGLGQGYDQKLGLTGAVDPSGFFPSVNVSGYTGLVGRGWSDYGKQIYNRTYSFAQRFDHTRGRHTLKFGFEAQPSRADGQLRMYPSGNFSFGVEPTALNGIGGNALASLLLGFPMSAYESDQTPLKVGTTYYAAYVTDEWKIRKNLTLSLGTRWETQTQATVRRGSDNGLNLTSFNPNAINPVSGTPGVITYPGINGPEWVTPQSWNLFGPRVGIAWQITPKTVFRSGGGFFYPTAFGTSGFSLWAPPGYGLPGFISGSWTSPDNGITAPFLLKQGIPPVPAATPGPGFGAVPVGQSPVLGVTYSPYYGYHVGVNYEYNATIERSLPGQMVFSMGYVASLGRKLTGARDIDEVQPALFAPGDAQVRRPFPQYSDVTNAFYEGYTSNYHSLEVRLEKRLSSGLSLLTNYTYGVTLTDTGAWNSYNLMASYHPDGARNMWVNSWTYDLPAGSGKRWFNSGPLARVVGGWKQAGIISLQSGQYLDITSVTNTTNGFMTQGVNAVGNPQGPKTMTEWFNTAAFVAPAQFTLGNAGRGSVIGPGQLAFDASLIKNTQINERFSTELHVDFLNVLNHTPLCNPNTTLGAPGFGSITCKGAAVTYVGNSYSTPAENRELQLGVRFIF